MSHLTPHHDRPTHLPPLTRPLSDALTTALLAWTHPTIDQGDNQ